MNFQPDATTDGLYYPSGQPNLGPGIYGTDGLTETPSGSDLYAFAVGDYAYPSLVPVPHVEIAIFTLDPATVNITVYRTAGTGIGRRTMPVRGQINVYAVGGRAVVDWEAPFGIPLTYQALQFDADGNAVGTTNPFTTQLDVDQTWIHNVFNPLHGVTVTMAGSAAASLGRPTPVNLYYPNGGGLATGTTSQRQGLTDVDVSFLTFDLDTADEVDTMFGNPYISPSSPPVLCIRTASGDNMRLPQPFYALTATPNQVPLDLAQGGSLIRWETTATEVNPPAPSLVGPVLTYNDFDVAYPATYASEDAAYLTYLDADRDYSLSGLAGE